jgi:DNA ligase (NAD+)
MDYKKKVPENFKDIDDLSKDEAKEEIEKLRDAIEYHDYRYYVKNDPVISDRAYDRLFKRLETLEDKYPDFQSENSPTKRVGAPPVDELEKVEHAAPMLSLSAALKEKEAKDFDDYIRERVDQKKIEFSLEPKFDGFSVEIVYKEGEFQYGATRGDGKKGENISRNLKTIGAVPLKLREKKNIPSFLSVRGEVYMRKDDFQEMNKKRIQMGKDPFANPRNAAAGTMRQLDPKNVADKPLDVFFYQILKIEGTEFFHHREAMDTLKKWGFPVNDKMEEAASFDEIKKYHQKLENQRENLNYDIDGVVIKLMDYDLREKLGYRERNPRWAWAWKFPPKKEVTTLKDITVQVGRTGMLTPVALLEPVDVGGVTVSRATLHNADEVKKKDVRPGDKVKVERAGDVIPEIDKRVERTDQSADEPFSMPDQCPVCGGEVVKEGAYYFCSNGLSCPAQLKGRILHYASSEAMDIEGLGKKTVETLIDKEMVKDIADLYHLEKKDFKKLEGFAKKSASNLYHAIQDAKQARMDTFLYALGVREIGQHMARVLAENFKSLDELENADREELEKIDEIGPETALSITHFFEQESNRKTIEKLLDAGVKVKSMPQKNREKLPLYGKKFVFTGALDDFTRDEAQNAVEKLGADAVSSVSGNTDYVVAGENPGRKLDDAKKEAVEILNEDQFKEILDENRSKVE